MQEFQKLTKLHNCVILWFHTFLKKSLWPIFMDGVQLPQGYKATARKQFTFYHSHLLNLKSMRAWIEIFLSYVNVVIIKHKLKSQHVKLTHVWPLTLNCVKVNWQESALPSRMQTKWLLSKDLMLSSNYSFTNT